MKEEFLNSITETVEGYPVKNLVWKPIDNLIRGLVKDPITGNENLHGGYVTANWNRNGALLSHCGFDKNKRKDLYLKIE